MTEKLYYIYHDRLMPKESDNSRNITRWGIFASRKFDHVNDLFKNLNPLLLEITMNIPPELVESVKKGQCNLFLGAMVSAPSPKESLYNYKNSPPGGTKLSLRLAELCNYEDNDSDNLQRVSLFFEHREHGSRELLVKAIINEITAPGIEPSPALHMLASLPFGLIITTNFDHLFDNALRMVKTTDGIPKQPIIQIYNPDPNSTPDSVPYEIPEHRPILLKLHGDIDKPESLVVTEEDYIVFIQRMSDNSHHPIQEMIRARLLGFPTLFIGYSLKDYNLRLLFRTLRWNVDNANFPLSYSVDPYPDNLIVSVWQKGEKRIVSFIKKDLWDFVPLLYKECKGVSYQP